MQRTRHGLWRSGWALALALALGAGCRAREAGPAPRTETAAETSARTSTETAPRAVTGAANTPASQRPAAPVFADIAADLEPLRARFQEDDGLVRVIMLVAPT